MRRVDVTEDPKATITRFWRGLNLDITDATWSWRRWYKRLSKLRDS